MFHLENALTKKDITKEKNKQTHSLKKTEDSISEGNLVHCLMTNDPQYNMYYLTFCLL